MIVEFHVVTSGQGLYEITESVSKIVSSTSGDAELCTVFVRHTSASLVIQENADPTAKRDLEGWLRRLVPENDPHFTHTFEGADDMPAHIKAALTPTSIGIPVSKKRLMLGTWQGIYLWEHRSSNHSRSIVVQVM